MFREQLEWLEGGRPSLTVSMARSPGEILEAQRLRYSVFAEEMGARLDTPMPGVDADRFDPHCEHLIVRHDQTGEVVGTYRILSPAAARRAGGYYSEQEFDIARLAQLRDRTVEIGRSCIHSEHRSGAAISLLWAGLARYMLMHRYEYLIGCASIGMADGGHGAASLYRRFTARSLAPSEYRVFPRCPLPLDALGAEGPIETPPLIKGYFRAGAYVCGEPAWDPDFNTADLFMLLPLARIDRRYGRHFLGEAPAIA